jgi:hypothetical protein
MKSREAGGDRGAALTPQTRTETARKDNTSMKENDVKIIVDYFKDGIATRKLGSWRDFDAAIKELMVDDPHFVFRGHRKSSWELKPSLAIELEKLGKGKDYAKFVREGRKSYLETFKRASQCRRGPNPVNLTDVGWWALARHHGMPSPLLDLTTSPFVAAYFAFWEPWERRHEKTRERAVFALLREEIESKREKTAAQNAEESMYDLPSFETPTTDDNARQVNQNGLFCFMPFAGSLESWVAKHFQGSKVMAIFKFVIPEKDDRDRDDFLIYLNRMNINNKTLFPDIGGAAAYCRLKLEIDSRSPHGERY